MFGYITINGDELKFKDIRYYNGVYCGVCQDLGKEAGQLARTTLTYDMTFLALLLTCLYEEKPAQEFRHCLYHLGEKKLCLRNTYTGYAADMNLMLAYHNLRDDWRDDASRRSLFMAEALKRPYLKIAERYPRQRKAIIDYLKVLHKTEALESMDLDEASGQTGRLMREIFIPDENDIWAPRLGTMGFFLGKFIYLMDAYDDIEKDIKKNNYNPWKERYASKDFEEYAKTTLQMMTTSAAAAFEKLPIVAHIDILRNILYSGIWTKFAIIRKEREKIGPL